MLTSRNELARVLEVENGLLVARDHPGLVRTAQRLTAAGALKAVLPGVFADPEAVGRPELRIQALASWLPDAVLTGEAAAFLTFWPEHTPGAITATHRRARVVPAGFALSRGVLPPELITEVSGVSVSVPALTALDLAVDGSGAGIDQALLRRACTLADMHEALRLTPGRPGNVARRGMLHDSRDEPWSEAERLAHAILREAGITGWETNVEVCCGDERYFVDVAFRRLRLGLEIDGFEAHSKPDQFHRDRQKWSDLTAAGWRLLHVTWTQLVDEPEWVVSTVRAALASLARVAS